MNPPSSIPPQQLERIQPVLDKLLTDLRRYTRELTPADDLATDYRLSGEAG